MLPPSNRHARSIGEEEANVNSKLVAELFH
jgi:hypothetical protein